VEFGNWVRRAVQLFVPASGHKPKLSQVLVIYPVPFL
jgi:hypothetical protein